MKKFFAAAKRFVRNEEGLTTVEYAVAGALVTVAVVTAFTDLGTAVQTTITDIKGAVATRNGGG